MTSPTVEYVTAQFPEGRVERVTRRRAMVGRVHKFVPPASRLRLRKAGERFGRWRKEPDGVGRIVDITSQMEVGEKLIVQRESDGEQLSIRILESLFIPDLGASPMIELLSAELVAEFGMDLLRDGGLYVCRFVDGTRTPSRHAYVKKTAPTWKGSARDWFVKSGGMTKLKEVYRFQVSRVRHHNIVGAHVIVDRTIYTHPSGESSYGGIPHFHTHNDIPGGVPCL